MSPMEIDYPDGGKMTANYEPSSAGWFNYLFAGLEKTLSNVPMHL
jgi:hypothetical protein